jgi:uncharacterized lipoprotein NlpE involved in copper resistance
MFTAMASPAAGTRPHGYGVATNPTSLDIRIDAFASALPALDRRGVETRAQVSERWKCKTSSGILPEAEGSDPGNRKPGCKLLTALIR